jgi:hypothetical protein
MLQLFKNICFFNYFCQYFAKWCNILQNGATFFRNVGTTFFSFFHLQPVVARRAGPGARGLWP